MRSSSSKWTNDLPSATEEASPLSNTWLVYSLNDTGILLTGKKGGKTEGYHGVTLFPKLIMIPCYSYECSHPAILCPSPPTWPHVFSEAHCFWTRYMVYKLFEYQSVPKVLLISLLLLTPKGILIKASAENPKPWSSWFQKLRILKASKWFLVVVIYGSV